MEISIAIRSYGIDVKQFLKYYVPTKYPDYIVGDYAKQFESAHVTNPYSLLRKVSLSSTIICALVAALSLPILSANWILAIFAYVFTYLIMAPYMFNAILKGVLSYKESVVREKIDRDMYSLILTFLGFARGNLPVLECIKSIANSDFSEELKYEFRKIYSLVRYAGNSLRSAILEVALTTPSKQLSDFLKDLSGVFEATSNLIEYLENRLTTLNITRTVALNEYLERLRTFSELYLFMVSFLSITLVVFGLFRATSGGGLTPVQIEIFSVTVFPAMTLLLILLVHARSPEKEFKRVLGDFASALVGAIFILLFISVILDYFAGIDLRLPVLILVTALSALALPICEGRMKFENGFDNELIIFANKLMANLESRPLVRSILSINSKEFAYMGNYVRDLQIVIQTGEPMPKVFEDLHRNAPTFMSKVFAMVMSKVLYSGNLVEAMHHMISEFHNYLKYKQTRSSITRTIGSILIFCFIVICAILLLINNYLVPLLNVPIQPSSSSPLLNLNMLSKETIMECRKVSISIMFTLLAITPLGITAIDGDVRKYFRYFTPLALLCIVLFWMISSGVYLPLF